MLIEFMFNVFLNILFKIMHQLALFVLHNFREHNQLTRSFGEVVVGTNELRGCDVAELRCLSH